MSTCTTQTAASGRRLDPLLLRAEFPILEQMVHGHPLVYLDNAATTQKPRTVLEALERYYERDNANVHRGVHLLSQRATDAFEAARRKVARFVNASPQEIVFTRGTTEAVNLVAQSFGLQHVQRGDAVLVSHMEHHSNIVPWQLLCERVGAKLLVIPIDDRGVLELDALDRLLSPRVKLLGLVHASNALGTLNPVAEVIRRAHAHGIPVLLDGAQALPHAKVDVKALDVDFYACSAHKVYGPTGIGALYAKKQHLQAMPPWQGGGDMILSVSFAGSKWNEVPFKFEAGTPDIAGAIGFGAALDWVDSVGLGAIAAHEAELLAYATERVRELPHVRLIGTAPEKVGVLSFVFDDVHPHDVGTILDQQGVAVRTGHHCAQPVMERYGVPATVRASFAAYNTRADVDALVDGLRAVREMFRV
ncbi:MAG: cysteine desulfurase [Planctomycetes bacterium]|nr:cysteine desulfurase [Planctomycetota bacterium]